MKIYSKNVENNYLDSDFGANVKKNVMNNSRGSFHIGWSNLPKGTASLALEFYDNDAVPVCGFTWIHWLVSDIDPTLNELKENASFELKNKIVQGMNSSSSPLLPKEMQSHEPIFSGCAPPDTDHKYTVKVYALNKKLNLVNGFKHNELINALEGSVLESAKMNFMYKKVKH